MHFSASSLLTAACLVLGSPLPRELPAGVVQLGVERVATAAVAAGAARRAYSEPLAQSKRTAYLSTIQVGTPAQSVQTQLDTGSSDLWVYGANGPTPEVSFDPAKSSTYQVVEQGTFGITYGKGSAQGDWVIDTVAVSGATIQNQRFAVATGNAVPFGVFGVGLADEGYPNYPQSLRNAGLVNKNAYSLYLNSYDAAAGNVLFGGIDTAKYSGKLHESPLTRPGRLAVSATYGGVAYDALLDSGTTFTLFTDDVYDQFIADIQQQVPNLQQSGDTFFVLGIENVPEDATVKITLGGTDFEVPTRNLFGQWLQDDFFWALGVQRASQVRGLEPGLAIYGDSLLRSFYIVYNLEDAKIAIAPVVATDSSNIVAIGSDGIPSDLLA